ncbi:MAG: DUF6960 family protein [Aeoliella sp.]
MAIQLKTDPKYGYYPWWPEDGDDWVHPEDVSLARSLIPSPRVFRRDGQEGPFILMQYGQHCLRVRRTLWRELRWEGFDIGDLVEVRPRGMKNEHRTGSIRDVLWDDHKGVMHYRLEDAGHPVETHYTTDDLKHVDPTKQQEEVRIEPSEEE